MQIVCTTSSARMDLLKRGLAQLGFDLTRRQLEDFRLYYRELVAWNQRINLTRIVECSEVQTRHFLDSLTVSLVLPTELKGAGRIIDIGSGAGFPGLPLKIACPGLHLALVESVGKKAAFLKHMVDLLRIPQVQVYTGRAEALAHEPLLRETFDVVLARGLAPMRILAELTLPFCRLGGLVVAHKKGKVEQEIREALPALAALGGELREQRHVDLEGLKDARSLVVICKVQATPSRYPRRPGIPRKRPL